MAKIAFKRSAGTERTAMRRRDRWSKREVRQAENLKGFQTPIQVCPRGCEHSEHARRDVLTKTTISGRASVRVTFAFETDNCPKCGAPLVKSCARCERAIYGPVVDRCRFCGLPPPWAVERRPSANRAAVQRWRREPGVRDPARLLYSNAGRGDVWVVEGDIARIDVGAIVSNDDVDGQMWAQVSRAIKSAAGSDVERLAREEKPYKLGEAWWTKPGSLELEGIIHVAAMDRHGKADADVVEECLVNAIEIAEDKRLKSLGIPAFGSGPNSVPPDEWFRRFAEVSVEHLSKPPLPKGYRQFSILLVLFDPVDFEAMVSRLAKETWKAWINQSPRERYGRPHQILEGRVREMLRRPRWHRTAVTIEGNAEIGRAHV